MNQSSSFELVQCQLCVSHMLTCFIEDLQYYSLSHFAKYKFVMEFRDAMIHDTINNVITTIDIRVRVKMIKDLMY